MAESDPAIPAEFGEAEIVEGNRRKNGRAKRMALIALGPIVMVVAAFVYWMSLQGKVSTDNAYVQQDKVSIASEVTGAVSEVFVHENQRVAKGDLLFRIDADPYRVRIAQANAAIAEAQANVTALRNDSALTGSDIAAARESIAYAQAVFSRQDALWKRGFTTKADYDAAEHTLSQAREELRNAIARREEARARLAEGAAVPGENPQIASARAQKAEAELNLKRTEIYAPASGRVAQSDRLLVGQQALPGLPMLTLVTDDSAYVEANFKETDLTDMRVGQRAKIAFDAYPGLELDGHVASIGAGTGAEFSVLPAQNATGNWVKVTQRVPVRIAIDEKSPREMISGLSAEVTVYTDKDR